MNWSLIAYPLAIAAVLAAAEPAAADPGAEAFGTGPAAIAAEDLDHYRGMANPFGVADAAPEWNATVAGNQVAYYGDATITQTTAISNSFNNATGIFTVVQNSGNNVLIQNATMVTINMLESGR